MRLLRPRENTNIQSAATLQRPLIVHTDGAVSDSAGGAAAIVQDERGQILALANRPIARVTNNEAEYVGLLLGLELLRQLLGHYRTSHTEILMDSEVVVYQMTGRFGVSSAALKRLHRQACVDAQNIPNLTYRHIPRENNRVADALAAEAACGRLWSTPNFLDKRF